MNFGRHAAASSPKSRSYHCGYHAISETAGEAEFPHNASDVRSWALVKLIRSWGSLVSALKSVIDDYFTRGQKFRRQIYAAQNTSSKCRGPAEEATKDGFLE